MGVVYGRVIEPGGKDLFAMCVLKRGMAITCNSGMIGDVMVRR